MKISTLALLSSAALALTSCRDTELEPALECPPPEPVTCEETFDFNHGIRRAGFMRPKAELYAALREAGVTEPAYQSDSSYFLQQQYCLGYNPDGSLRFINPVNGGCPGALSAYFYIRHADGIIISASATQF